ncbi:MAG TPA: sugar phosphate isomerase/epimerase [Pyrinomonadaceae bacterium]
MASRVATAEFSQPFQRLELRSPATRRVATAEISQPFQRLELRSQAARRVATAEISLAAFPLRYGRVHTHQSTVSTLKPEERFFMSSALSRRQFIIGLSAVATVSALPWRSFAASHLDFGYAAITWEGNDLQAIKDVSSLGFRGIQLRSNVLTEYGERPEALRDLLVQYKLQMIALSSGGVSISTPEADEIAKHVRNAKFVKAVGGKYLQVTDSARPKDRKPEVADFKQLGKVMTEIGRQAGELGVAVGYHNHMQSLGESPDEVDQIMNAVDPRYVKLELDIAHYLQGGGDPIKAIERYHDRILFLHIKDVESLPNADMRGRSYRFVELGRGRVDLSGVFAALKKVNFSGWAIIELDAVPDKSRSAKECAEISIKYLKEKLGLKIV